jgi:aspartyl-tRNA(Asn)/glutamyl-tRNA(Gln) amidotransferase subunit B
MRKIFVHIGLEVHCQLLNNTKIFSGCKINSLDRYTLAYPGTLPVVNEKSVEFAVRFALALDCKINKKSRFDRKHYFYKDLPKGYQLTQNEIPLAENGKVMLPSNTEIPVTRIHIEEDAGKTNRKDNEIAVDYSRAGVPLIEIVTPPKIKIPEDASSFVKEIKNIAVILGINNGNLQNAEIRCDANVSVSYVQDKPGAKVEIKNLNSFKFIRDALKFEIERQSELLRNGQKISECTMTYNEQKRRTEEQRKKETVSDYRYLPEPDIPPLIITDRLIEKMLKDIPELPFEIRKKLKKEYDLQPGNIELLIEDTRLLDYYYSFSKEGIVNISIFNSLFFNNLRVVYNKKNKLPKIEYFLYVCEEYQKRNIPKTKLNIIIEKSIEEKTHPKTIINKYNYRIINDENIIRDFAQSVINEYPEKYNELISGNRKMKGFFIGHIISKSEGLAEPKIVENIINRLSDIH